MPKDGRLKGDSGRAKSVVGLDRGGEAALGHILGLLIWSCRFNTLITSAHKKDDYMHICVLG